MKKFIAILTCLLFVLSTGTVTVAADQAPACEGCGCAVMSCCSVDSSTGEQPVNLPDRNDRVFIQKLVALKQLVFGFQSAQSDSPLMSAADRQIFSARKVPLFIRNCQFLI